MATPEIGTGLSPSALEKSPTGIVGLDEITGGGLPTGRPTLICGSAGCGKTLFSIEFLVNGATQYGEPGVFMSFEETVEELAQNVASLGFDLDDLIARNLLAIDYVHVERSEIEETGEYDLEGLFIRLGYAIDSIGATRVVLDSLEALFGGLGEEGILRAELRRLFRWLKTKGVTAIITGERGPHGELTRHGLEEYVSDCVILLDHRVIDQISTRRLRIVKYRGSSHGTNEYPFLIDEQGISVLPITALGLDHVASSERVSSGIPQLDAMLDGAGFYRGSTILVSGTSGTGKSSLAAHFANGACSRGERCLYFAFEESESQIIRNMHSIGIDLQRWVDRGLLRYHNTRPTVYGLELHLVTLHKLVREFKPDVVIVDPITDLLNSGSMQEVRSMLTRMIDFLKSNGITSMFLSLTTGGSALEQTEVGISSLIDVWILLRDIELNGERNRGIYVLKARGTAHSNQIREFLITSRGINLVDVYLGSEGVLTGTARLAQEERERAKDLARKDEVERQRLTLEARRKAVEAQVAALRGELAVEEARVDRLVREEEEHNERLRAQRAEIARKRHADSLLASQDPANDTTPREENLYGR